MSKKTFVVICYFVLFLFCIYRSLVWEKITTKSLYDFDEARYAEVAKNIIKTGNWLIPMAGGPDDPQSVRLFQLPSGNWLSPYFWKPPLHPIVIAIFYKTLGINELSVRLPSLVFSLASLLIIFSLSITLFPKSSLISHLFAPTIFALSNDFSYLSSQGLSDAQLLFFILLSLYFATKKHPLLSALFFALAFLTKSFATLWLIPLILLIQIKHQTPKTFLVWAIISLVFILPWHFYMFSRFGQTFIDNYLIVNTIGRASGTTQNIAPLHWYTIYALDQWKTLVFLILPLSLPILKNLKQLWLPTSWFLVCFVFFSLPQSKVWWYIYPAWPALSLIASQAILSTIQQKSVTNLILLTFSVLPLLSYWQLSTYHIPIKQFYLLGLIVFFINIILKHLKPHRIYSLTGIVSIIFFVTITTIQTNKSAINRTDFNSPIKKLSQQYPGITHLAVSGLPYESALFYFDTGTITREINPNTTHLLTIENGQPVLKILNQTNQPTQ